MASSHTEPRTWVVELSSWRRRLVDEHRRAGQLPSAAKLLDISKAQWNAWQTPRYHLGYIYSWSLAGFLASSDEGRALLSAMLNRSSGSAGSVVEETWPDGLAGLDADWRAWIPKAPSDIRFVIEHPPVEGWLVCDGNVLIRKGPGVECPKTLIIRGTGR